MGAADKQVFAGETPKGRSTAWLEPHTVSAGTFTATNTSSFVSGANFPTPVAEVVTAAGAVLAKVASAPGPGQYSVSAGGVYTVDTGLNGATCYITYGFAGNFGATTVAMRDVNEWLQSASPSPFVAPTSGNSFDVRSGLTAR